MESSLGTASTDDLGTIAPMMLFRPPKLLNIIVTQLHFFVRLQLLLFATLQITVLYYFAAAAVTTGMLPSNVVVPKCDSKLLLLAC